jgi:hypothetical protein
MAALTRHQLVWVTAGIRRVAGEAGLDLPVAYARRVAADALTLGDHVALTQLGAGVVIHTVPDSPDRLPKVVGYADAGGQWYQDGTRHQADPAAARSVADGFIADMGRHVEQRGVSL